MGANSSFEKKAHSTVTEYVGLYGSNDAFVIAHEPETSELLKAKVDSLAAAIIDKEGDWNGYFQIRITGIPASLMQDGRDGHNLIGMAPADEQLAGDGGNAIAGRDTRVYSYDDVMGGFGDNQWYEFFMYNAHPPTNQRYLGPAGNYDIGLIVSGGTHDGTKKVLRDVRLEVGELNTLAYSSFGNL
ncbi:MAG: hypothetical protein LBF78_12780 [Treponema sp.]|nr:hypothetical protein [Treponema sp.]